MTTLTPSCFMSLCFSLQAEHPGSTRMASRGELPIWVIHPPEGCRQILHSHKNTSAETDQSPLAHSCHQVKRSPKDLWLSSRMSFGSRSRPVLGPQSGPLPPQFVTRMALMHIWPPMIIGTELIKWAKCFHCSWRAGVPCGERGGFGL